MKASEHLADTVWKTPSDYGGFNPIGDYCILSTNRDADALTRSNWECVCEALKAEPFDDGRHSMTDVEYGARPAVYHWRAGHWACGWVEYLMVRADAPDDIREAAGGIVCKLAGYPVYDENHFCELEYSEAGERWGRMSIRERADIIGGTGISIFSVRRDYPPQDDSGIISERLRG